jgi:hypothetical protein
LPGSSREEARLKRIADNEPVRAKMRSSRARAEWCAREIDRLQGLLSAKMKAFVIVRASGEAYLDVARWVWRHGGQVAHSHTENHIFALFPKEYEGHSSTQWVEVPRDATLVDVPQIIDFCQKNAVGVFWP